MNNNNNNFSLIRNEEINRLGPKYISPIYYNEYNIHEKMKEFGAYEDPNYISTSQNIWKRDETTYINNYCNLLVNNDYDCQYLIVGLDSLIKNMDYIEELYKNPRNDFLILDSKCSIQYLWNKLDNYKLDRMKCYTLLDIHDDMLIKYFEMLYRSCNNYEIINTPIKRLSYNSPLNERYQIINLFTNKTNKYLEIGVEYGHTFSNTHFAFENKVGVDPDPKCSISGIQKCTSDDYFSKILLDMNAETESIDSDDYIDNIIRINDEVIFDVIFIDGMHQTEYILKDLNNSIKVLKDDGIIFIDDILPLNYNEQLKIPRQHYYENGILKYGESWTGDVWKVLYHVLRQYQTCLKEIRVFHNPNYRGVAMIKLCNKFEIADEEIDIINNYDYFNDFSDYVTLLQESINKSNNIINMV